MFKTDRAHIVVMLLTGGMLGWACNPAAAAVHIEGQVQAGGGPLANSTVTLWEANAGNPKQLAQTQTGSDGRFALGTDETPSADVSLYLVAKGGVATVNKGSSDNPAIALLTVLGNTPPGMVVINEMTTVASVWTNNQFLDGTAIKGHALGLRQRAGKLRLRACQYPSATASAHALSKAISASRHSYARARLMPAARAAFAGVAPVRSSSTNRSLIGF
jgi:hypothetical protein